VLQQLIIQNYAIINELGITFSPKLNGITGETGAGKSIIVGALGLILGERADSSVLVNKDKKCIVEGIFQAGNKRSIRNFLEESDVDAGEEVVVRREIGTNGKSRAFINDTPVTLQQLSKLGRLLVDLHQQFDTLELGEMDFQRQVLDALAGHTKLLVEYQSAFREWDRVKKELAILNEQRIQSGKEADYNQFQFDELDNAGFRENELEEIDQELKMLQNAEGILDALNRFYFVLQESDTPVVQQLKQSLNQLSVYANFHPGIPALVQRLQSTQIELQDIAHDVEHISAGIRNDPGKTEQLSERLSLGYRLQKKHGVQSTSELLAVRSSLEEKLRAVQDLGEIIGNKEEESARLHKELAAMAAVITAGRRKQIKPLQDQVNKLLAQVGMPNARLQVSLEQAEPGITGWDRIEFLFDANKSGQFQPVGKVASGGELSRLMLCIKSLVAKSIDLPTLIFDEIDTGISGEAARQVGLIMKELAAKRQVICITHQPQIAGKADAHFFVYKEIAGDKVNTNIRQLTTEERITTIAQMLSGEKPTAAAIQNAREMVMN
jgi:DNA repair protein RecN (Recombination protein N)